MTDAVISHVVGILFPPQLLGVCLICTISWIGGHFLLLPLVLAISLALRFRTVALQFYFVLEIMTRRKYLLLAFTQREENKKERECE